MLPPTATCCGGTAEMDGAALPASASVKLLVTNKSSTNICPRLLSCRQEKALIVDGLATSSAVMDALISDTGSIQSVVTALLAT